LAVSNRLDPSATVYHIIRKHGFSFADAWEIFEVPMLIDLDDRVDYGEDRWIGLGQLRMRIVVVVYTEPDDETIRVIS
jgi:hypothetical protein